MRTIDRLQAVRRSAKYKQDYDLYLANLRPGELDLFSYTKGIGIIYSRVSVAGLELCRKYKIPFPIKPCVYERKDSDMSDFELQAREKARQYGVYGNDDIINAKKLPSVNVLAQKRADGALFWGPDDDTHQLAVTIDMMRNITEIKKDLGKLYKYFDQPNHYRNKKAKDHEDTTVQYGGKKLTQWEIYGERKKGIAASQIAKDLAGTKEAIQGGMLGLKALYDKIRRAENKAKKQIQAIERIKI